jgi:phosphoribosylglycinamide formyltransferase-1
VKRIAILASGRGSNFQAIARNVVAGRLDAQIACVLANQPEAKALQTATSLGLKAISLPSKGVDTDVYAERVCEALAALTVDLICLAGFMRRIGKPLLDKYAMRILNIHPSLLPSFPGLHVQQQALDYGVKFSGCTVHFVDSGLDTGPIVAQAAVPVLDSDDADMLAARILVEEHRIYSEAIALVLSGRFQIVGHRVVPDSSRDRATEP